MLVLDTTRISPSERAEAFQDTVSANCTTSLASFEEPQNLRAEMHVFDLGAAKVFNIEATGTTLKRTPRIARAMNESPICLALPMRTSNRLSRDREDQMFGARDLMLVDLAAPYVYGWSGDGASYAFHVEHDDLEIPMDVVHTATLNLRRSPLYSLVRDHIHGVMTNAQDLLDSGAAAHVGQASIELMRALIVSAVGDTNRLGHTMQTSMAPRLQAYIRRHLRDPDLSPARVARANGVSIRTLFAVYESIGVSLEQSIIEQRLHGVRNDLSSPRNLHRSIAAVSRAWGFNNPSFMATRFKRTFGMTPRAWRASSLSAHRPPSLGHDVPVQAVEDQFSRLVP